MEDIGDFRAGMRGELDDFLRKLEESFGFPHDYVIQWLQRDGDFDHPKKGKCKAFTYEGEIHIQTTSLKIAKILLVHEFIEEILVVEFTAPYNRLIANIIEHFDKEGYLRRERMVNRITRFIVKEMVENGG